jgi:hypothetical protein
MPYNTRRKSLSLPSLGIHVPMTNAARAASKSAGRPSSSSASASASGSASPRSSTSRSHSPDSHPSKRLKRAHDASADSTAIEATPPPSPTPATSVDMSDVDTAPKKVDLDGINDDIVEGVIMQLQDTGNRPHLIKELEAILARSLKSVQNSANPCAIISSRLASYMKRSCWSALAPCPLAKELETVHPRRTYYFLTTFPRQPLPESGSLQQQSQRVSEITPSVSLTDDSGMDELEERRRQLSPSPEIDLPCADFYDVHDDLPVTPMGSLPKYQSRDIGQLPHDLPPLEKDEREFTQTADTLQKRKFNQESLLSDMPDRNATCEYGFRDDLWFGDHVATTLLTSPAMKPSILTSSRKEEEADNWVKLNKLYEWDQGAESIEIDELDGLLDSF